MTPETQIALISALSALGGAIVGVVGAGVIEIMKWRLMRKDMVVNRRVEIARRRADRLERAVLKFCELVDPDTHPHGYEASKCTTAIARLQILLDLNNPTHKTINASANEIYKMIMKSKDDDAEMCRLIGVLFDNGRLAISQIHEDVCK